MFRYLFILLALWHWKVGSSSEQEDLGLDCVVATSNKRLPGCRKERQIELLRILLSRGSCRGMTKTCRIRVPNNYGDIPLQSMRPSSDRLRSSYRESGPHFVPFGNAGRSLCGSCVTLPGYTTTRLSIPTETTYCEIAIYVTEAFHYLNLSLTGQVTLGSCESEYLMIRDGNSLQKYCDNNQDVKTVNGRDVVYITYESRKPRSTSLNFNVESKYPNISDSSLMKTVTGKTINFEFYMPNKASQSKASIKESKDLDLSDSNHQLDYAFLEEDFKGDSNVVDIAEFFITDLQTDESNNDTTRIFQSDVQRDEASLTPGTGTVWLPDITLDPREKEEQASPADRNRNDFQFCHLCGQASVYSGLNKIVGGADSDEGEYPSFATVEVVWQNEKGEDVSSMCGGTIINSKNILTAAHCFPVTHNKHSPNVAKKVSSASVTVGDWRKSMKEESEQVVPVQAYIPHHSYVLNYQKEKFVDIAVIHLLHHLTFGPKVFPTCIASNRSFVNEIATVIGFGTLHEGGPTADTLQEVMMTVRDEEYCRRNAIHFDDKAICIEEPNKDSCSGDSGGPAYIQSDNTWYQIGIVSASKSTKCGAVGDPTVFTKVPALMQFLKEYTRKDGECFN